MDLPSPKFSSNLVNNFNKLLQGEDIGEDEEKIEIIRCILSNDSAGLLEILSICQQDITKVRDEMGYSLIHLAAYNNSEKSVELLIKHVLAFTQNS